MSGPAKERTLPWEPLLRAGENELLYQGRPFSISELARLFGVSRGAVIRWKRSGGVPLSTADRVTTKSLRLHPADIWHEDYWNIRPTDD